jgi:hypothetical protein
MAAQSATILFWTLIFPKQNYIAIGSVTLYCLVNQFNQITQETKRSTDIV